MTVLCGVREPGVGTWIASDQLVSGGQSVVAYSQKWVHGRRLSIGVAGHYTAVTALKHHIGKFKPDASEHAIWMTVAKVFRSMHWKPQEKDGEPGYFDCTFLFATADRLVTFGSTGGGVQVGTGVFVSRGSGCSQAEGAWSATRTSGHSVGKRLQLGIEAACEWDSACGGKPYVACWTKNGLT